MKWTISHDKNVCYNLAMAGRNIPSAFIVLPRSIQQLAIPTNIGKDAELFGAVTQILPDFFLRRKHPCPAWIKRKRKGVKMGRDITGTAGIRIITPGPA